MGIASLAGSPAHPLVELYSPSELSLLGEPNPRSLASSLDQLARSIGADSIFIDGPQGWRRNVTDRVHWRACEAATSTPGKTGTPGIVLPRPWKRMAVFSIAVFDALADLGWPRFDTEPRHVVFESFPTHAWRSIGHSPLPGKNSRGIDFNAWVSFLEAKHNVRWPRSPTHDEVQATVASLAGLQLDKYGLEGCTVCGEPPFEEDGSWREGYIVSPKSPPHEVT